MNKAANKYIPVLNKMPLFRLKFVKLLSCFKDCYFVSISSITQSNYYLTLKTQRKNENHMDGDYLQPGSFQH